MAKNKYFKTHSEIPLIQQKAALLNAYKESKCTVENNQLLWYARIRPTPLSKTYKVFVSYQLHKSPQIWVIGDELEKLDDINFPHKYRIDPENKMVKICLYRYAEFNSNKLLANTIIPWTIEWLYFYELWLATGEWCGGGEHTTLLNQKTDDSNSLPQKIIQ